ncbi:YaaA family protein [Microbacterium aureliae]
MLILLPPSETKRPGGTGAPLRTGELALPGLAPVRDAVIEALVSLSSDAGTAARVLGLGPRLHGEVAVNAAVRDAPTMPAVDRYTGVLFDALDAASLDAPVRRWLGAHAMIHSAPWGPVGALDGIPAYRLGAGVRLPSLPPPARVWADAVTSALAELAPRFVLDLRSEAYVALGPVPAGIRSSYVRVVTESADGAVRALNHFNKRAKGDLVRRLALTRPRAATEAGLRSWAREQGVRLEPGATGELQLFA